MSTAVFIGDREAAASFLQGQVADLWMTKNLAPSTFKNGKPEDRAIGPNACSLAII